MRLWKASAIATLLRSDDRWFTKYDAIKDFIQSHDDWMEAVMLWFDDEPRINGTWFISRIPTYLGIHAEEWIDLVDGQPIVPLIASESQGNHDSDWSVDDAFHALDALYQRELSDIVDVLSYDEATLFWQVALGESPPISKRHMLRALAQFTNYDTATLRQSSAYLPFLEVVERAVRGDLPVNSEMRPGEPIVPIAKYLRWNKVALPYETTYIDLVGSSRLFLHYTGSDALIFTRSGELVQSWESDHTPSIFEIECSDDYDPATVLITDVLVHGTNVLWKETYSRRQSYLDEHYKVMKAPRARQIDTMAKLREVLRSVSSDQTVRLLDDAPYYDDDFIGGYILQQQALKLPLLITHLQLSGTNVRVKLAALDGHTTTYIAEMICPDDVALNIRNHPTIGPRLDSRWVSMDDVGGIVWVSAVGIKIHDGNYHLDSPTIIGLDTSLGFSDTAQLSDVLSIMG